MDKRKPDQMSFEQTVPAHREMSRQEDRHKRRICFDECTSTLWKGSSNGHGHKSALHYKALQHARTCHHRSDSAFDNRTELKHFLQRFAIPGLRCSCTNIAIPYIGIKLEHTDGRRYHVKNKHIKGSTREGSKPNHAFYSSSGENHRALLRLH